MMNIKQGICNYTRNTIGTKNLVTQHSLFDIRQPFYQLTGTLLLGLFACVPIAQQGTNIGTATSSTSTVAKDASFTDKKFRTSDFIYEDNIKTVLLYPQANETDNPQAATLQPAVLPIEQGTSLILEFDELGEEGHNYHAKIYHCNADWAISLLTDNNFLSDYNDFTITNYQLSVNTKTPYTHYRMEIPKVKLPGNYVVMAYREGNVKDMVLSRRFMVYDNTVSIASKVTFSTGVQERNTHQQVDFTLNYKDYQVTNPRDEIKIVLRQNFRWDNAITGLKPMNVRMDEKILDYNFFNLENDFRAGNEFRFFDMRSIRFLGMNMAKITTTEGKPEVLLATDQPRSREAYAQVDDFNGMYVIDNYETHQGATDADYVQTIFTLKAPQANGAVYVNGKFNEWLLNEKNRMMYSPETQEYKARILLKQGIYNYNYAVEQPEGKRDETYLEGSFYNTENTYEIIAYYRPLGSRADLIIGYKTLYHNARNR